jgi:hypothetical protein
MARSKKNELVSADLLAFLPDARRRELLDEAAIVKAREIIGKVQSGSLGAWVEALQADTHWPAIKDLKVATVLSPARGRRGRPPGRGRRGGLDDAAVDSVARVIGKNPGLRSEQIYKEAGLPPQIVKAALARLREKKRVKTKGTRRAMTYALA